MFHHGGITQYHELQRSYEIEMSACREAQRTSTIKLDGHVYKFERGEENTFKAYLKGTFNPSTLKCQGAADDGRVETAIYSAVFTEEDATLNVNRGVLSIPTGGRMDLIVAAADNGLKDSEEGTYVWRTEAESCPESIVTLYNGPLTVRTNNSNTLVGGFAIFENKMEAQVRLFKC